MWRYNQSSRSIFYFLKGIGYKKDISVKSFRAEYYEIKIEEAIKIIKEETLAVVEKYF